MSSTPEPGTPLATYYAQTHDAQPEVPLARLTVWSFTTTQRHMIMIALQCATAMRSGEPGRWSDQISASRCGELRLDQRLRHFGAA